MMSLTSRQLLDRRNFLQTTGTGILGATLGMSAAPSVPAVVAAAQPLRKTKADQMIVIYLPGGPPHTDMFDLKPDAPSEYTGGIRPIQTNVPGFQVSEFMPRLAQIADKYTIIRSCSIDSQTWGHSGTYWLTSNPRLNSGTPRYPGYGQVISKLRPAKSDLPSFVSVDHHLGQVRGSYLGPAHEALLSAPGATATSARCSSRRATSVNSIGIASC